LLPNGAKGGASGFLRIAHAYSRLKTALAHKLQPSQLQQLVNSNNHCKWVWRLLASFTLTVCLYYHWCYSFAQLAAENVWIEYCKCLLCLKMA